MCSRLQTKNSINTSRQQENVRSIRRGVPSEPLKLASSLQGTLCLVLPPFRTVANNKEYRDFVSIRSTQTFSAPCEGRGTVRKDGGGVVALLKADSTAIKESLLWLYVTQFSPSRGHAATAPSRRGPLWQAAPADQHTNRNEI